MVTKKVFSILIIFHNEERGIKKTLDHIFSQKYPKNRFEVICINDGGTDASGRIVKQYPTKLVTINKSGISTARNIGLRYCTGTYVLFLDAHLYLKHRDTLQRIERLFRKYPQVVGVCGEYWSLDSNDKNYTRDIRRKVLFGKADRTRLISLQNFTTWSIAIGAYKRVLLNQILFPEGFTNSYGEDTYLQIQLHNLEYQLLYSPDIGGVHDALVSKSHLLKKMMYEIRATGNILLKASSEKNRSMAIPYLHYFLSYPLGFVIFSIVSFFSPWFLLVVIIFLFLEVFPLRKIIFLKQYPLNQRFNTFLYVVTKELVQAYYLPFYILFRTHKPSRLLFIFRQMIRWEVKKAFASVSH
ncbi:MAG: glycosyltransferase [Candidatus Roizmanbacteria bacterium]|nr:glycosyltransferase [Candidatus Roizmanbacteria bacterium]